ncbi:Hypothetical protein R9X50_00578500 [Acrodontium crateriforme]|uniref:Uncharacterized protein n=1 Tax=Acrodontium crateriforme TaxID=150365 RepID=A0AAQ3M8N3_9PEZI|nr:Hypothetical protein R9X50_00578500 [Acrodontium crateriforme]
MPSIAEAHHRATSPLVVEHAAFEPRKLRVVCVGAGYSGLILAHKFKHEMKIDHFADLCIYEKNHDIGGTWLENRYPGVACDVPAHAYTFPFEPNPDWSSFYVGGQEIFQYMKRATEKYNLAEKVVFNARVTRTSWNESTAKWDITVKHQDGIIHDSAEILINGAGVVNKWIWPSIAGLDSFKGTLVHSAAWDDKVDWARKRVGLIGNGASGIQILPKLQKTAQHVTNFFRSPTWISPSFVFHLTKDGMGTNFEYSEEEKKGFRDDPEAFREYRRKIEHEFNTVFSCVLRGSEANATLSGGVKAQMEARLRNDPDLCEKLIPKFEVACRRLTPGDGYLEALQQPNVSFQIGEITSITPNGIIGPDGKELDLDIIVCATGFDTGFTPSWELHGRHSISLAEQWKDTPEAYFALCAANMPNYMIFNGPNYPAGHGSLIATMNAAANWMVGWIQKFSSEEVKTFTVKEAIVREYNDYSQAVLKRTVWSGGCRSWYKNGKVDGPVTAMYAGSSAHYIEMLERFRTEDFDVEYRHANRFAFMGNGLTVRDVKGEDLGWYVK